MCWACGNECAEDCPVRAEELAEWYDGKENDE